MAERPFEVKHAQVEIWAPGDISRSLDVAFILATMLGGDTTVSFELNGRTLNVRPDSDTELLLRGFEHPRNIAPSAVKSSTGHECRLPVSPEKATPIDPRTGEPVPKRTWVFLHCIGCDVIWGVQTNWDGQEWIQLATRPESSWQIRRNQSVDFDGSSFYQYPVSASSNVG